MVEFVVGVVVGLVVGFLGGEHFTKTQFKALVAKLEEELSDLETFIAKAEPEAKKVESEVKSEVAKVEKKL